MKSTFETLAALNCNEHTEKKNGLTYLSWAWAWHHVKKEFPLATYTIYETPEGRPYFDDGHTCWVKTGVTIEGLEHIEYLPIMDYRNVSIPKEKVTSMDMNKAIQRSLTKACARHGLGLYIYAGEDLPDEMEDAPKEEPKKTGPSAAVKARRTARKAEPAEPEAEPEPEPYRPVSVEDYEKIVKAHVAGKLSKTGKSLRDTWIAMTNAGPDQIVDFDLACENYRINGRVF